MFLKSILPVQNITAEMFDQRVASAELVIADLIGPKVMRLKSGNIIKLIRRKHIISSAIFAPYAIRFSNNAFRLKELDILTITPIEIQHCHRRQTHIVEYQPLPGEPLRSLLQKNNDDMLFQQTAAFIAELHRKGVYFRSLHFENVIHHKGRLGLIDIADMKFYDRPLKPPLRRRNFQHFMRYPADVELINRFGFKKFESAYLKTPKNG